MAQPLTANARLTFPYTIDGLTHVLRAYAIPFDGVAVADGQIVKRNGDLMSWKTAAAGLSDIMSQLTPLVGGSFGDVVFEARDGIHWNPVDSWTPDDVPGGGLNIGIQTTLTLRTTNFKPVKVIWMENGLVPLPSHYSSIASMPTAVGNLCKLFTDVASNEKYPYFWQVSRNQYYLADSSVVALTTDLNDKTRRARGLA